MLSLSQCCSKISGLELHSHRDKTCTFPPTLSLKPCCFPQSSSGHQQVGAEFSGLFPHFISLMACRLVHLESELLVYAQSSRNQIKMQSVWYFLPPSSCSIMSVFHTVEFWKQNCASLTYIQVSVILCCLLLTMFIS